MKILTVAIPCFNSEKYMKKCIHSLLPCADNIEILIIDDGSTDRTGEIADAYAKKFPGTIRAIHQENGGHGEAVNTGIKNATGLYFKVIDSDDWADQHALHQVVHTLLALEEAGTPVDMLLVNFIYDKVGKKHKTVMHFRKAFPENEIFDWSQIHHLKATQYILMHNIFYRKQVLVESKLHLPAHTFYVDNIFAFAPYPYVKKMYYLDVNFYHYFIGREDQSVNENVMISRIDQQIKVNKIMIDIMASTNFWGKDPHLRKYMYIYLDKVMTASSSLCLVSGTEENLQKKKELWTYLRRKNFFMWLHLRNTVLGMWMNLPGWFGRKMSVRGYKIARRFLGFN